MSFSVFRRAALSVAVIITACPPGAAGDELRAASDSVQHDWPAFCAETLSKRLKEGNAVLVYFRLDSCPECKRLEKHVWNSPKINQRISAAKGLVAMWADLTERETDKGKQNLERMRAVGSVRVPTIAIFRQGAGSPETPSVLVSGRIDAGVLVALIDDAVARNPNRMHSYFSPGRVRVQ